MYHFLYNDCCIKRWIKLVQSSFQDIILTTFINFSQKYLPLSDIGMGWVVLSLIGFIIGFIIFKFKHRKIPQA
ncbi:branched-chain amino acid transport system II carrier protein [Staphylococcus aureus]